jgi:lipopolysaccharide export system permease protein
VTIFRSIAKEVFSYTAVITVILMMVIVISRFLYFLNHAAMGLISMNDLFKMMIIIVSLFSVHVVLLSFYLAIIFVLGRLFSESEMTALFASGLSRKQLLGYMMSIALVMSVLIGAMVLWLEPMATYSKDIVFAEAMTSAELSKILPNRFESVDNGNKMVYVTATHNHHGHRVLDNVTLVQHTDANKQAPESWDISTALTADKQNIKGSSIPYIVLAHGHRVTMQPGAKNISRVQFGQYGVQVANRPPQVAIPVEGLSTSYLLKHWREQKTYLSGLQYRFSVILSVFLLTLIAVPLSYVAPRHGRYLKLIPALLIYLLYIGLVLSNKSWIIHSSYPSWILLCWLQVGLLLIGIALYRYGMGPFRAQLTTVRFLKKIVNKGGACS